MEKDIQNYLPSVMFRETPCTMYIQQLCSEHRHLSLNKLICKQMVNYLFLTKQIFVKDFLTNFDGSLIFPAKYKFWTRSVQQFGRLRDTNRQAKYK